jgi:hypothetical protein
VLETQSETDEPTDDAPSVEKILWANTVEALLVVLTPKQRLTFLKALTRNFRRKRDLENVMRIRPKEHDERLKQCIREAETWTHRCMAVFIEGTKD